MRVRVSGTESVCYDGGGEAGVKRGSSQGGERSPPPSNTVRAVTVHCMTLFLAQGCCSPSVQVTKEDMLIFFIKMNI